MFWGGIFRVAVRSDVGVYLARRMLPMVRVLRKLFDSRWLLPIHLGSRGETDKVVYDRAGRGKKFQAIFAEMGMECRVKLVA